MSRPRIGEILLRRGACDQAALRAAWEQKVIFGDRLGTNLLALDLVDEEELALALGEQHGVHAAHGEVLQVSPRAARLVPSAFAVQRRVLPHHVAAGTLWLLMVDPDDHDAVREVRIATGHKQITPVVVCEARMWALLTQHHGAGLSMRPIALDRRRARRPEPQRVEEDGGSADLVSEEEFQRIYAGVHAHPGFSAEPAPAYAPPPLDDVTIEHRVPLPAPPASPPPSAPAAEVAVRAPVAAEALIEDDGRAATTLPLFRIAATEPDAPDVPGAPDVRVEAPPKSDEQRPSFELAPPLAAPAPTLEEASSWRDEVSAGLKQAGLLRGDDERLETSPQRPMTLPEEAIVGSSELQVDVVDLGADEPLTFAEASALLRDVHDRTEIARVVLRYARSRYARAALLTVHPHHFVGWEGIGEGLETQRLRSVVLERKDQSVFSLVMASSAPYIGPLQKLRGNGSWVKATGKKIPKSVVVLPILVRGAAINLLYGDNGHGTHVDSDVGELLIVSRRIADSYEALLKQPAP